MSEFIAVDWGTTNRRAYRIKGGRVVASEPHGPGVTSMAPNGYEAEIVSIRQRLGDLPVLLAGMVGSTIGWREVPYVDAPASIEALAARLCWTDERTAIVPGLAHRSRPDVMRGEEVQIFGAYKAGDVPGDALLCQPGTHCKWVELSKGAITSFATAMTGELFALLKSHSVLSTQLTHQVQDDAAFAEGVAAGRKDLLSALFSVRAAAVLGLRKDTEAASYVSGLIIGSDVDARQVNGSTVYLLADPPLAGLYSSAIALNGGNAILIDSTAAFVAGATAIQGLCQ